MLLMSIDEYDGFTHSGTIFQEMQISTHLILSSGLRRWQLKFKKNFPHK